MEVSHPIPSHQPKLKEVPNPMVYPNGGKSRFGFRFKPHQTPDHSRTGSPRHEYQHVGTVPDGGSNVHDKKPTTTTVVEESSYRAQPTSPQTQSGGERKTGFPEGLFRRPRPTLITNDGWARPSPTGWKLPPEAPLVKAASDINPAAAAEEEELREPIAEAFVAAPPRSRWGQPGWNSEMGGRRVSGTIDSREAVRRYGGQYI